jgi:hypothetical protein
MQTYEIFTKTLDKSTTVFSLLRASFIEALVVIQTHSSRREFYVLPGGECACTLGHPLVSILIDHIEEIEFSEAQMEMNTSGN